MQIRWIHLDSTIILDLLKSFIMLIALLITRALVVRWIARNSTLSIETKRRGS